MSISTRQKAAMAGIILLLIPVSIYGLWIHASNQTEGYPDNVNLFHSYFPSFLQGRYTTTLLSLVLCLAAVVLNILNLSHPNRIWKTVSLIAVIVGGLLGFLNLFSMM
jgi:hypothetical protein